jgi:undecaprenyl-diphosphatase
MEHSILLHINREWTSPALDLLMGIFSSYDFWRWPLLCAAILTLWLGGFRARTMLLCLGVALGLGELLVINPAKHAINKPRPHQAIAGVRVLEMRRPEGKWFLWPREKFSKIPKGEIEGRSFPSGHTFSNFCAAMIIARFYRRRGWLAFIPATLVGYSRIYSGSHWPIDVLGSLILGLGWAVLILTLLSWSWRRWGHRWSPGLHARYPELLEPAAA